MCNGFFLFTQLSFDIIFSFSFWHATPCRNPQANPATVHFWTGCRLICRSYTINGLWASSTTLNSFSKIRIESLKTLHLCLKSCSMSVHRGEYDTSNFDLFGVGVVNWGLVRCMVAIDAWVQTGADHPGTKSSGCWQHCLRPSWPRHHCLEASLSSCRHRLFAPHTIAAAQLLMIVFCNFHKWWKYNPSQSARGSRLTTEQGIARSDNKKMFAQRSCMAIVRKKLHRSRFVFQDFRQRRMLKVPMKTRPAFLYNSKRLKAERPFGVMLAWQLASLWQGSPPYCTVPARTYPCTALNCP